jgi:hypothetical protein
MSMTVAERVNEILERDRRPNTVHAVVVRKDGRIEDIGISENLRTNAGTDWLADVMGKTTQPAPAQWIALTANTGAPAAGDTVLTGELSTNGMARAQGVYAHTNGTSTYTITVTFTATGTSSAIHKAGLFNASSAGTLVFETNLSADVSLVSGDTLTVTWTVTLS